MPQATAEQSLQKLVGLFLAEIIRSRRTSIRRAAEISRHVLKAVSEIHSEEQALSMLSNVERDFEEVLILKQALHFGNEVSSVNYYEPEIKQYAAELFEHDMTESAAFLQDAAQDTASVQELCIKYPGFCQFLLSTSKQKESVTALAPG